ncbi:MAG: cyclase family protein [Thermodesulfobacteriota bacterium]
MKFDELLNYQIIDLEYELENGMPEYFTHKPVFGYEIAHRHSDTDPKLQGVRTSAWGSVTGNEHSGTHVDAFCHQAENGVMHGGYKVTPETETQSGFTVNGAEHLPIFFDRGVLLDIAAFKGVDCIEPKYEVSVEDIEQCCQAQSTQITPGCVVLVHLGHGRHWRDAERYLDAPGVSAAASQMMADLKVKAVGADNFSWDEPSHFETDMNCNGPGHIILLVRAGIYIFENLNLLPLVDSGETEFIFFASPIKLKGATAAPVRPLALINR